MEESRTKDCMNERRKIMQDRKNTQTKFFIFNLCFQILLSSIFFFRENSFVSVSDVLQLKITLNESQQESSNKFEQIDREITRIFRIIQKYDSKQAELIETNMSQYLNVIQKINEAEKNFKNAILPFPRLETDHLRRKVHNNIPIVTKTFDIVNEIKTDTRQVRTLTRDQNLNICTHIEPNLSPLDPTNNFTYNEDIRKTLSILYGLTTLESLSNRKSPQYKAACWIVWDDTFQVEADDPHLVERFAFATYYFAINNDGSSPPSDLCGYHLIECNEKGRIVSFDSSNAQRGGFIPSEFFNMFALEHLNLNNSLISGTIPPEIGRMKRLRTLCLSNNNFQGSLPSEIGDLIMLEDMQMNYNQISGSIPTEIGYLSQMTNLQLSVNQLTGSIPEQLFQCTKLSIMNLENNRLSGSIPAALRHLEKLKTLIITRNKLTGRIPSEIGLLSSLEDLWLRGNQLSGTIPQELGDLNNLVTIILEKNQLTGKLDGVFDSITYLSGLNLGSNKFTGEIPEHLWNIDIGLGMNLEWNDLSGSVPKEYCSKSTVLKIDNSMWQEEPKVSCSCCTVQNCHLWDVGIALKRPLCPSTNLYNLSFSVGYRFQDLLLDQSLEDIIGLGISSVKAICISPTGCYSIENDTNTDPYLLQYSNGSHSLETQDTCDAVPICGNMYGAHHPKREGLNHLTQLVVPDISINEESLEYMTLCWILTEDNLYNQFHVCDGTLLQRYVLKLFFLTQGIHDGDFENRHTCDWDGILCDDDRKNVLGIDLRNQGLRGNLNTELGLLTQLREINLSNNKMEGTLDPVTFKSLPYLELFNVASNDLSGKIPDELLILPRLKKIYMSSNLFHGSLPYRLGYSKSIESIDIANNLLQGTISKSLFECNKLKHVDLSQNTFLDFIPSELGELKDLTVLRLNKNKLRGSIPVELFKSLQLEELMIQSNDLTGSIPTQVGKLINLKTMSLSYNALKGKIPTEMEGLESLRLLQLHHNRLSGVAPQMENLVGDYSYITDCGIPSFSFDSRMICPTCSECCNSVDQCKKLTVPIISLWLSSYLLLPLGIPLAFGLFMYFFLFLRRSYAISLPCAKRSAKSVYNEDSVYCLIFSKNRLALIIYIVVAIIQGWLYSFFLQSDKAVGRDREYNLICPDNSLGCHSNMNAKWFAWGLFYMISLIFLGPDLIDSIFQLYKAVVMRHQLLLFSGTIRMFLTILALYSTRRYNLAASETNTDVIVNTVIALFVNDIDEQCLRILENLAPIWMSKRYKEIQDNLDPEAAHIEDEGRKPYLTRRMLSHRFSDIIESSVFEIIGCLDEERMCDKEAIVEKSIKEILDAIEEDAASFAFASESSR